MADHRDVTEADVAATATELLSPAKIQPLAATAVRAGHAIESYPATLLELPRLDKQRNASAGLPHMVHRPTMYVRSARL